MAIKSVAMYKISVSGVQIGVCEAPVSAPNFEGGVVYGSGGIALVDEAGAVSIRQQYANPDGGFTQGPLDGKRATVDGFYLVGEDEFDREVSRLEKAAGRR